MTPDDLHPAPPRPADWPEGWDWCPRCATALAWLPAEEDGGLKHRVRCPACGFTHWNNPTPVLAAVIECTDRDGHVLLARNAAWPNRFFGLITGFMEAGETPEEGIRREVLEETALQISHLALIGVYDFQRMNQVIIAYHAQAQGEIRLSPELLEYKLLAPTALRCWPQGTGQALADWLRSRGIEPQWLAP
ncbi:NUDIX domain-containing protein [Sphaerotilus microaerophilus]|jgi:NADH pyrophosphatase NudC (nudix superfamily)|uniref:Phosphatase n=1 Tax=Sphaerotilus microaerophilus TaxID=2914710 RepID=A0ABN6PUT1_9BURK|nr:NUDIX domain-containing protein [Sphaerotilus sp. FB-5]BDI07783.1 phosphatase [Sphaerotilus sp. FB-5]